MTERHQHRDDRTGRVHAIELRSRSGAWEIGIMRKTGTERFEDVWRGSFDDRRVAASVFRVMRGRPARWDAWSEMARLLGAEFVLGLIRGESAGAAEAALVQAREDLSRARRGEAGVKVSIRFELWLHGVDSAVVALRGDEVFLRMEVGVEVEALRIWDWVRWQAASFWAWYDLTASRGSLALVEHIQASMVADERRLIAAGLSPGGRRPLRYWWPMAAIDAPRARGRDRRNGSDAHDADPEGDA